MGHFCPISFAINTDGDITGPILGVYLLSANACSSECALAFIAAQWLCSEGDGQVWAQVRW
jgi:hypothetical protein